jgi:histidyl-tRNA synthetase
VLKARPISTTRAKINEATNAANSKPDGRAAALVAHYARAGYAQAEPTLRQVLRNAGVRAELYLGSGKMGPQLKYADKRGAPCVVIQGGDEKAKGEVQIKDLIEGAKAAAAIASNQEWRETRPAQFAVKEEKLVEAVREVLARHNVNWDV